MVDDDRVVTYRMQFQDCTPATLTKVLTESGLTIEHLWSSLTGAPLMHDSPFIAVAARPTAALETWRGTRTWSIRTESIRTGATRRDAVSARLCRRDDLASLACTAPDPPVA